MTEAVLTSWRKLPAYRERRAHVFESSSSLQWFVRKHRRELVQAGALVLHAGQWFADEPKFDAYVQRVSAAAAKLQAEARRVGVAL